MRGSTEKEGRNERWHEKRSEGVVIKMSSRRRVKESSIYSNKKCRAVRTSVLCGAVCGRTEVFSAQVRERDANLHRRAELRPKMFQGKHSVALQFLVRSVDR